MYLINCTPKLYNLQSGWIGVDSDSYDKRVYGQRGGLQEGIWGDTYTYWLEGAVSDTTLAPCILTTIKDQTSDTTFIDYLSTFRLYYPCFLFNAQSIPLKYLYTGEASPILSAIRQRENQLR